MKLNQKQIELLVESIFKQWKSHNMVTFKDDEKKIFNRAIELIQKEFQKESDLEKEAHAMVAELERNQKESFDRHKMYLAIKAKLAKDKKVVL